MAEEVTIDVRLSEQSDEDSDRVHGRLNVRVSDPSGSPLPAATITVSGHETDYEKSKSAKDMGMAQTFENVPMPADVHIEATGYQSETITVTESDLGSDDITRGY